MNKQQKLNRLFAIALALALIVSCVATLVACNDENGQTATITVSFDLNDGVSQPLQKTFNSKEEVDFTPPTREEYDFVKWTLDKEGTQDYVKGNIQSGATLYAQWKIKTFAVYFFVSDVDTPVYVQTVEYGKAATAPSDELIAQNLAEGDVFVGWSETFDCVKSELYVYAVTAKANCTVIFKNGDEVISEVQGKYGQLVDVPDGNALSAPFGYEFDSWQDADGNVAVNGQTVFKSDAVYSAHWVLTSPSMPTVKGNLNVVYGQSVELSADVDDKIDGVDYTYEWYVSGKKVADGKDVSISNLACGTYYVRCSAYATKGTDKSYPANKTVTVFVQKATLSVTISTINVKYGDSLPSYAFEYSGFVYDDDESVVDDTNVIVSTPYEQFSPVGEYEIEASGFASDNYDIVFTTSKIVVNKKEVSAKAPFVFGKNYDGQTLSQTFATASFEGVCEGHVLSLVLTTNSSVVGQYDYADGNITSVLKISDADGQNVTSNYSVSYSAVATISLATIDDSDYTVPTAEENTFVYDAHAHGEPVRSDEFYVTYSATSDGEYTSEQLHFVDAGVYTVYYKVSHENYLTVNGSYVVTINKAKLDVTIKNQSTVYGADFEFDQTLFSVSGNDYHTLSYAISCAYEVGNDAGAYPIELIIDDARGTASRNFDITVNDAVLTVEKAPLNVTLNPVSVTYGDALVLDVEKLATASGLYKTDVLANVVTLATDYAADKNHGVNGEYYVYCSLNDENGNYTLSAEKAKVTVVKRQLRVRLNDMSVMYGESIGKYDFTIVDGTLAEEDDAYSVVNCQSDYVAEFNNYTPAGNVVITATSGNVNYELTVENNAILEVTKRPVTIRLIPSADLYYGRDASNIINPLNLSITVTSDIAEAGGEYIRYSSYYSFTLVRGQYGTDSDEEYVIGMTGSFELRATPTDNSVTRNYDITVTSDEIKVAPTTYILEMQKTFAYNKGNVATFNIADALKNVVCEGDEIKGTISTKSGEIGVYEFVKNYKEQDFLNMFDVNGFKVINSDGDDVTAYYEMDYYSFDIKLEIVDISIAHNVQSLTKYEYDGYDFNVEVDVLEDNVTLEYSIDNENWTTVVPSFKDVLRDESYQIQAYTVYYRLSKYIDGIDEPVVFESSYKVQIEPRKAYIKALDQYVTYGDTFTIDQTAYEYENIVADDVQYLKTSIITYGYKDGADVGKYTLRISANINDNYLTESTNGTLYVTARSVKLVQNTDYEVVYGEQAGVFTDFRIIDDDENAYEDARQYITVTPVYKVGDVVGVYSVTATCSSRNYEVRSDIYIDLEVIPRNITVKTNDARFVYGQNIVLDYTITEGTLYGDDKLEITFDFAEKNVGKYEVMPRFDSNTGANANYDISTYDGVITIEKATLTVALSKTQTITYGDDMPNYDVTYTGFAYDETTSVLKGMFAILCDYHGAKRAGTFDVIIGSLTADNYNVVYVNSTLIVKKAALTITAKPHEAIVYGDDVPNDFEYEATGFVNGDDENLLAGKVSFSTLYFKGADASSAKYTFNMVCSELENYIVNVGSSQTLVVNKADYTKAQVEEALAKVSFASTYKYGETLGAYSLTGTGFDWINHNELVTCDMNETGYRVNYCKDKVNYNVFDDGATYIKINLAKADASFEFDGEFGARWTGKPIDFASIMSGTTCPDGTVSASLLAHVAGWNPTFTYSIVEPSGITQMIDGGIYKVRVSASETANYNAAYIDVTFNVFAAQLGNVYMTVENALEKAKSGDTVYLVGNAFLSKNVTVQNGVTLILGLKTANYTHTLGKVDTSAEYAADGLADYAWKTLAPDYTLTIRNGATLTLTNGNVLVAGLLGHAGTSFEGHTSGAYSKIINDGAIVVNGGIFDIRGLVTGSGNIVFNGGNVYCPFVVRDFKGGDYTVNKCWSLVSSTKIAPFSEYEMPNIQCTSRYYSGATLSGYADLYANKQHNITTIKAISANGILRISEGGYVEKSYDSTTGVTTLTLVGNVTLGSLELKVTYLLATKTVKMSDTFFPIPWTYNVNIGNGSDATAVTAPHDYKVMPSGKITVNANAKLTTTGNVIVYSNFVDQKVGKVNGLIYPESKGKAGFLVLNGGEYEANAFGGIVSVTQAGGNVKINKTTSVTAYEHSYDDKFSFTEDARLENGTILEKGTLYTL